MQRFEEIERSIVKKYRKEIWIKFIAGVKDYKLIQPNDKIAVCISGGKDSMLMAKCMQQLQKHSEFPLNWNIWLWTRAITKSTGSALWRMQSA
jgi:tRNA(Ile)-lysidine synthase TilS/MesJ